MVFTNRYQYVFLLCLAIAVVSSSSLFWYLNVPVYDFLAKNRIAVRAPEVVLIESDATLSQVDERAIINALSEAGVRGAVIIRDKRPVFESDESQRYRKEPTSTKVIDAYPVSERELGQYQNRLSNTLPLLEPSSDYDGIARTFDPQRYHQIGLKCSECNLALGREDEVHDARPFLINYLNYTARLPQVSAEQVLNDWLPKGVLDDKVVVVDLTSASIKDVYRTNLFVSQKVTFSYFVASVLNTQITQQKHFVLPFYGVLLILLTLSLLISLFLRDVSLNSAMVLIGLSSVALLGVNVITLGFLDTFVPVVEYIVMITAYLLYAVRARNSLVLDDLKVSNGELELALAETNSQTEMEDTELCSGLYRFFARESDIRGLSVYETQKPNHTRCVLTFDKSAHDEVSTEQLIETIENLGGGAKDYEFVDDMGDKHLYLLIPIRDKNTLVASIAISVVQKDRVAMSKLIKLSEKYRDELNSEIVTWLANKSGEQTTGAKSLVVSGRRRTLAHRNRHYVSELMARYKQAKRNYNHLDSAVAIYDIYGNLMSINASAEEFAQSNSVVWYDTPLNQVLLKLTNLKAQESALIINRILMSGAAHRFTLKGELKEYIGVLSHRKILNQAESTREVSSGARSFLCFEIINVSNIGTSARLKDSYVRDLTNQIKQDLSKLTLLVDQLSMTDRNTEKYHYLSEVLEKLSERVRASKKFIVGLPDIEKATHYSVNVLEKLDETLDRFEQAFSEKNIKLVYNKPAFVNQIVLDYRSLEFIFNYLFDLLIDDSLTNSVLDVRIQESTSEDGRIISIVVKNSGYGLPQELLNTQRDSVEDHPLKRCEEFARTHGGEFNLSTKAGKGIEFRLELPVKNQLH